MMTSKSMMILAAAAAILPAATHAEVFHSQIKPTIVVMHRNIQNLQDEQKWKEVAIGLANDGYRVVSVALKQDETADAGRDEVVKMLNDSPEYGKLVLVGTAAASETLSKVAEAESARVNALAYISAEPTVATLGPREVSEPNDLVGAIPSFQVKITAGKRLSYVNEKGASFIKVREEGKSTLARIPDLTEAIETIATSKVPVSAKTQDFVASLR